jgi:hypothetical protein
MKVTKTEPKEVFIDGSYKLLRCTKVKVLQHLFFTFSQEYRHRKHL